MIDIEIVEQKLPLMEQFYTLQGEGKFAGQAAYFIRLAGCDVGCHWCDVKDSWHMNNHPKIPITDIIVEAQKFDSKLAVVTGGEPLMHHLKNLTLKLQNAGFQTNIETSGVCKEITGHWNWICFSPKKFKDPNPAIYNVCHELKVIVYNNSDFEFAEFHANKINKANCELYLQPEWGKKEEMTPKIVEYIKQNPKWKLSLQTHKYIDIP